MEETCPICKRYGLTNPSKMVEDGEGFVKSLGRVKYLKCLICKTRLPKRTGRVKTLQGVGKP